MLHHHLTSLSSLHVFCLLLRYFVNGYPEAIQSNSGVASYHTPRANMDAHMLAQVSTMAIRATSRAPGHRHLLTSYTPVGPARIILHTPLTGSSSSGCTIRQQW